MAGHFKYALPFGAEFMADGTARFRVWAPVERSLALAVEGLPGTLPMASRDDGWFELATERVRPGARYRFTLADGMAVPDPASRFQPNDVHGPSQLLDPCAYAWRTPDWKGRPWAEVVLYEAHLGCFSREGSFDGARRRLDHLARIGITALELMPIADFEGRRNWGYDGVLPFAPDSSYGTPDQLKRLIDEAHERRLMVFLDVVYNHFGPSGNYLGRYAPGFFNKEHTTPWGEAINFDGSESGPVRDFFIHNALYWLEEYRIDGLRLDAVHAIHDGSQPNILVELAETVRHRIGGDRKVHLVLENDRNSAHYLERGERHRATHYDAQWNDDFHHAAHVVATGEAGGYYGDYAPAPVTALARALAEGFAFQGEPSAHRKGALRGEPSAHLPPFAFVSFLQNHDQVGNRAYGERLATFADAAAVRALRAILLLSPQIPMLFMGEEWGARRPFLYFCDFADELAAAVRDGRRREFARFPQFRDPVARARIPDPNAVDTFLRSRLDWSELEQSHARAQLELVRSLIVLRREALMPHLSDAPGGHGTYRVTGERALLVDWQLGGGARLHLAANLSPGPVSALGWRVPGRRLYELPTDLRSGERVETLPAWAVCVTLEADGGTR
jgi:maltooligosyltrehalose trehalohydrolase